MGAVSGGEGSESVSAPMRWDVTRQVPQPSTSTWEDDDISRLITMVQPVQHVQPPAHDSLEDLQLLHSLESGTMLEDGELPANIETCLALNRAYQEIINYNLERIELILGTNKEKQQSLQNDLDEMAAARGGASKKKEGSHYAFYSPYFRDVNGMLPPLNMDVLDRMGHCEMDAGLKPARSWNKADGEKLVKAVQADALKKKLVPLMTKKELYVEKKLAARSSEEAEELKAKLKEMDKQMDAIKHFSNSELLKDITDDEIDWMKIAATDFLGAFTADQCHLAWTNAFHQDVYRGKWTSEEDEKLTKIAREMNYRHWDIISEQLREETKKKRTAFQCLQRYQRKLNKDMRPGRWTPKEDEMLTEAVTNCRTGDKIPWKEVSACMEGRSQDDCMRRWNTAVDTSKNVRGRWTEAEDQALLDAVKNFGEHWPLVTHFVPNRNAPQCRERWYNALDDGLKKGDWTYAEDRTLIMFVQENGKGHWNKLAAQLPGRTDNMVLQRYRRLIAWEQRKKEWESQPKEVRAFFEKPYKLQPELKKGKRQAELSKKKKLAKEALEQLNRDVAELTSFDTMRRTDERNECTNAVTAKKQKMMKIKEEPEEIDEAELMQIEVDKKNGIIVPRPPKMHPHRYLMGSVQRRQEMMDTILSQVKKLMNKDPRSDPNKAEKIIDQLLNGEVKPNDYQTNVVNEDLQRSMQSMRVSDMLQISREMKRLICGQAIKRGKGAIPPEIKAKHAKLDKELARLLCWRTTRRKKAGRPRKYMANEAIYDTCGKPLPSTPDPSDLQPKITYLMMRALSVDTAGAQAKADEIIKQQSIDSQSDVQASKSDEDPYLLGDVDLMCKLTTASAPEEKRNETQTTKDSIVPEVNLPSVEEIASTSTATASCSVGTFADVEESAGGVVITISETNVASNSSTSVVNVTRNVPNPQTAAVNMIQDLSNMQSSAISVTENLSNSQPAAVNVTEDLSNSQPAGLEKDDKASMADTVQNGSDDDVGASRFGANLKTYMSASHKTFNESETNAVESQQVAPKISASEASQSDCLPASVINAVPSSASSTSKVPGSDPRKTVDDTQNISQVPGETVNGRPTENSSGHGSSSSNVAKGKQDPKKMNTAVMAEHSYNTTIPPLPPNRTTLNAFKMLLLNRKNLVKTAGPRLKGKSFKQSQKKKDPVVVYVVDVGSGKIEKVSKQMPLASIIRNPGRPTGKGSANEKLNINAENSITLKKDALEKIIKNAPDSGFIKIKGMDAESTITLDKRSLQNILRKTRPRPPVKKVSSEEENEKGKSKLDPLSSVRDTHDYRLLEARCRSLFLWPAMLSTMAVKSAEPKPAEEAPVTAEKQQSKTTKKARRRYPCTGGKRFRKYTIKTKAEKLEQVTKLVTSHQARRNAIAAGQQYRVIPQPEDQPEQKDTSEVSEATNADTPPVKRGRGRPAGSKNKVHKVEESDMKRSRRLAGHEKRSMKEPGGFVQGIDGQPVVECKKPKLRVKHKPGRPPNRAPTCTATATDDDMDISNEESAPCGQMTSESMDISEVESPPRGEMAIEGIEIEINGAEEAGSEGVVPVTLAGPSGPACEENSVMEVESTVLESAGDGGAVYM